MSELSELGYVILGGALGIIGYMGGSWLYHWRWMRRWDREHKGCCR